MQSPCRSVLVDARNFAEMRPILHHKMAISTITGFDIETSNKNAHAGILKLESKKTVFDHRRTIITGCSFYFECDDANPVAYYLNMNHADTKNNLPYSAMVELLAAKPANAYIICHNAPFELTMLQSVCNYLIPNVICSLQLCVTAYNSDTYPHAKFLNSSIGGMVEIMKEVRKAFAGHNQYAKLNEEQEEIISRVCAKETDSAYSYNGYVKDIAYGFGLKKAIASWFDFKMTEYAALLKTYNASRMDELTGEQVVEYGCDDAYWCVMLYKKVVAWLMRENPQAIPTFFSQENPMIYIYSSIWLHGWKVAIAAIYTKQKELRLTQAVLVREMKQALKECLPFHPEPHEKLMKYDVKWYPKNVEKYRNKVLEFINTRDVEDPYLQARQVRGAIANAWAEDLGKAAPDVMNITHYMPVRTIMYDLCGFSYQMADGKTQSDKGAQDVMLKRFCKRWAEERGLELESVFDAEKNKVLNAQLASHEKVRVLLTYRKMQELEQSMKLYITNFIHLTDPDTSRMYPTMSCMLDTRRPAVSNPNTNQLTKMGSSAYVRGFFEGDTEDHIVMSADWSSVELVLIGEESADPVMVSLFNTRPPQDMHSMTGAGILGVTVPQFKLREDYKEIRKAMKVVNFGYFYSGALSQAAKQFGWSSDLMWENTDKFRNTYAGAETWRVKTIDKIADKGFVTLKDGLRRYRFEATALWANTMRAKFAPYDVPLFTETMIKRIQRRSGNQAVNSIIQGGCATLMKRTALKMKAYIESSGVRARLLGCIYDELVYSVHKDDALAFSKVLYTHMIDGHGLMKNCLLDSSLAIGKNFEAFKKGNERGQIELSELPELPFLDKERYGKKATDDEIAQIIEYLTAA